MAPGGLDTGGGGMSQTPEGRLKADVLEYLTMRGEYVIRMNPGRWPMKRGYMHGAPIGCADLLILRAVCCWIELKAPGGATKKSRREAQLAFRQKVLALGHRHIQADSVERVMEFLNHPWEDAK